jgi:hypothetical protein
MASFGTAQAADGEALPAQVDRPAPFAPHPHAGRSLRLRQGRAGRLVPLPPPRDEDLAAVLDRVVRRTAKILVGYDEEVESDADALAALQAAEVDRRLRFPDEFRDARHGAFLEGFSLHTGVWIHRNDREGRERLCRYALRPPFALQCLSPGDEGRLVYRMKRPRPARCSWCSRPTSSWRGSPRSAAAARSHQTPRRVVPTAPGAVPPAPATVIPTRTTEKPRRAKLAEKTARIYRVPRGRPAPEGLRNRRAGLAPVQRPDATGRLHRPGDGGGFEGRI